MPEVKKHINDPGNYANMSVPFESIDAANEALTNFFDEVGELRKKHKIPDVLIVTKGAVNFPDGPGLFMQHFNFGSSEDTLSMAAYVYGQVENGHKQKISKLLAGKL